MNVVERKLEDLIPYENNPRINGDAVEKVEASIREFGFNVPILIDENDEIVAGHSRYEAARRLGLDVVPCIVVDGLSEDDIRQFRIVDNKTTELASWDYEKLAGELDSIPEINMDAFEFAFGGGGSDEVLDPDSNLDEGIEIDLSEFEDEAFECECPYCGFRWNK